MKHKILINGVFLLCLSSMIISCNPDVSYSNQQSTPSNWLSKDTLVFDYHSEISISDPEFILSVRNNTDYKYQNLFFFVRLIKPNGEIQRDTLECQLADYKGEWLGTGLGKIKEVSTSFGNRFLLTDTGDYKIVIEHAMRLSEGETLVGIEDVGIQIINSQIK